MNDMAAMEVIPAGCPLDSLLKFLSREWMAHVVRALGQGGMLHFGVLRRAMPDRVSARMLTARLRELQALGLVARRDAGDALRKVEYSLTEDGAALDAVLRRLQAMMEETPLPRRLAARA
ncbi:MAG: transcriptional regulator, HxlR family [Rubritepida sp.]|nr:transcriptional regulator, HxlR family [Rubritepida sp.]